MSSPARSDDVFQALKGFIKMPDNVISLELRLGVEKVAEMTLVLGASLHGAGELPIVAPGTTKRYHLVEIES